MKPFPLSRLAALFLVVAASVSPSCLASCIRSEAEGNDTLATASYPLCSGVPVVGKLSSVNDVDWIRFDAGFTGTVTITMSHAPALDFDWKLYDAAGAFLASSIGAENPATGNFSISRTGTFYLQIARSTGTNYRSTTGGDHGIGYSRNSAWNLSVALPRPRVVGKVWLNGGATRQENTGIFVDGLRQATGKNISVPDINSTSNCDENWSTTPCPRVAVITAAAVNEAEGIDKYSNDLDGYWSYANLFRRHGFAPRHILSHWNTYRTNSSATSSTGQANIAIINQADLVFVIGGDQSRLARTFLNNDGSDTALLAAIRARQASGELIYAGDSAGTAIAPAVTHGGGISIGYLNQNSLRRITPADCPYRASGASCLTYPDPSHPDYGSRINGFGFVPDAAIDTHFDNRAGRTGRLGRLLVALKDIGASTGYGIDQDTALFLDGDNASVHGSGAVFIAETTAASFPLAGSFKAEGVRLSYLTRGDRYRMSDGSITTGKALIAVPAYSGHLDSMDIFDVDGAGLGNTTRTITRMIDQEEAVNLGAAPSDIAYGNPLGFVLSFRKDATTQGYRDDAAGAYTIKKSLLDVD